MNFSFSLQKVLMTVFLAVFLLGISVEASGRIPVPPKGGGSGDPITSDGSTTTSRYGQPCYDNNEPTVLPIDIFNDSENYDLTDPSYFKNARILNIVVIGYTILDKDLDDSNRDIDVGETQRFNLKFSVSEMTDILSNRVDANGVLELDIRIKYKQRDVSNTTEWWNIAPAFVTNHSTWEACSNGTPRLAPAINEVDLKISPNPTKDNLNVDFNLEESSEVSLSIFNSVGREVKSILINETLEAGTHNQNVSLEELSSGVYYLILRKGDEVFTEKLVKI